MSCRCTATPGSIMQLTLLCVIISRNNPLPCIIIISHTKGAHRSVWYLAILTTITGYRTRMNFNICSLSVNNCSRTFHWASKITKWWILSRVFGTTLQNPGELNWSYRWKLCCEIVGVRSPKRTIFIFSNPTPEVSQDIPVKWKPVRTQALEYLHIGQDNIRMSENLISERMKFWESLPIRSDLDDSGSKYHGKDEL